MSDYKINILHLYPDLLNLYGDKGNIECLKKRLMWRGIDVQIQNCTVQDSSFDVSNADIIFLGGGADREIELVSEKICSRKSEFKEFVEKDGTLIALCSGFPLIGKYISVDGKNIEGLDLLDIVTETDSREKRLIGNVVLECEGLSHRVIGFENHGSRTDIGDYKPLGKVIKGFGNNGTSGYEGVCYKNVTGTYLHGPLFPKNPELCDKILSKVLTAKYPDFKGLSVLDDNLEIQANEFMEKRV